MIGQVVSIDRDFKNPCEHGKTKGRSRPKYQRDILIGTGAVHVVGGAV